MRIILMSVVFFCAMASYANDSSTDSSIKLNGSSLPIKATRRFETTLNEGSYMNVDMSPDGKKLMFDLLGDVFIVPVEGGRCQQITRGLALNSYPKWSPDSKYVAYCSDRSGSYQIHLTSFDQKIDKILTNRDVTDYETLYPIEPVWSLTSSMVAISGAFLYKDGRCVPFSPLLKPLRFVSHHFQPSVIMAEMNVYGRTMVICRQRIGSSLKDTLYRNLSEREYKCNFRISPDELWLTYMQGPQQSKLNKLVVLNLQTGEEKTLLEIDMPFTQWLAKANYSFSPDSKTVFIGYKGKLRRINISDSRSSIIPFTANVKIEMGPLVDRRTSVTLDSFDVKYCRDANQQPNANNIVFSALGKIYIRDALTGTTQMLSDQPFGQFNPTYSPSGNEIVYVSWKDSVGGKLWRISSNGGKPEEISTSSGLYMHPNWSSDGKKLLVMVGKPVLRADPFDAGTGQLRMINVETGEQTVIADSVPLVNNPHFSPDGKRVNFKSRIKEFRPKGLVPQLVSRLISGLDQRVEVVGKGVGIRNISLSPDNSYALYSLNESLFLVPIPSQVRPIVINDPLQDFRAIEFSNNGVDPHWEDNGKVVAWTYNGKYYRSEVKQIIGTRITRILQTKKEKQVRSLKQVTTVANTVTDLGLRAGVSYGAGEIALVNARIVTMHGNEVIENGNIIIRNGRIASVGDASKITIPSNVKKIDCSGKTIIPGLIDMHSHMKFVPPDVNPQQSWEFITNLAYGITTARDPSGSFDTFGYIELLKAGEMIGPRLYTVGAAIRSDMYSVTNPNEADIIAKSRFLMGGLDVKQYSLQSRYERQLLLMACKKFGLSMTNETITHPLGFLGMLKDGSTGVEHNPIFEGVYSDVINFVAKSGTYLTPCFEYSYQGDQGSTFFNSEFAKRPDSRLAKFVRPEFYRNLVNAKKINDSVTKPDVVFLALVDSAIYAAGGTVVSGSHFRQGTGLHEEIWMLKKGGLSNLEALKCGTINGAKALGMEKDLGSIEIGKIADLVVLEDNPLNDIKNTIKISQVIQSGIVYNSNMDKIWPQFQRLTNNGIPNIINVK